MAAFNLAARFRSISLVDLLVLKTKITFEIATNSCDPMQQFQFLDGQNNKLTEDIQIFESKRVKIDLNMEKSFVKRLQIITDGNGCKISGDERELFFELKNLEYTN